MNVSVHGGAIQDSDAGTIVVNLFQDVKTPGGATGAVDAALDGAISELIAGGDLSGKAGEVAVLYPRGAIPARRVLVAGLGEREAFDLEALRRAAGAAARKAQERGAQRVATIVHGGGIGGLSPAAAAQATVEGTLLSLYDYQAPRQKVAKEGEADVADVSAGQDEPRKPDELLVVEFDAGKLEAIREGVQRAEAVVAGVTLARDLVNDPPNVATPTRMADVAQAMADEHGFAFTAGDREWAVERGMGAFLAVAKGAGEPPRFIVLEHNAGRDDLETIVFVGKGITFDTGGISLKSREGMGAMKSDMAGAAAVLGAMKVVGAMKERGLDLPLHVVAIAPTTENMPDGLAYRPADVITASNGKTIEIISTDAEGRMVLADGLVYAAAYDPAAVVDLATLTGAAITALGSDVAAALFSTDDMLAERLEAAGKETYERVWRLPLYDDYREKIQSDVADIKNSGGRQGGVGTSATFLKEFTAYPWAHLDIAGMAMRETEGPYGPAGATGFGVRLLTEFLQRRAAE